MQHIMWNMKTGMLSLFSCQSYGLPSLVHSDIANMIHFAAIVPYISCID
jgi:hypothetical protein